MSYVKICLLLLIASTCTYAKLTRRQLKIIHTAILECGEDIGMKDFQGYELRSVTGRQTVPDARFKKLLLCVTHRLEWIDCDGTVQKDNFGAFLSDGHNNQEQLPVTIQECIDRARGSPEDQAFQLYQCMWSSRKFKV